MRSAAQRKGSWAARGPGRAGGTGLAARGLQVAQRLVPQFALAQRVQVLAQRAPLARLRRARAQHGLGAPLRGALHARARSLRALRQRGLLRDRTFLLPRSTLAPDKR